MSTRNRRKHRARRLNFFHDPLLVCQTPASTTLNAPDDLQRANPAHSDALKNGVCTSILMDGSLRHTQAVLAGRIRCIAYLQLTSWD
jgi:hypothetical protein